MSEPVLYYFDSRRGDAEAIRMMFLLAGISWKEEKLSQEDFESLSSLESGVLPFGRLPMVDFDGMRVTEQAAILEHIATLADSGKKRADGNKFCGANDEERATARSLCSAANQIRRETMHLAQNKDRDAIADFKKRVVPFWFGSLDRLAVASDDADQGLGAGVNFTFGDLAVFEAVNAINCQLNVGVLRPYPNLKEWHDKAYARKEIQGHLNSRPDADW